MVLVAGLGITGKSVLNYFASQGAECWAFDTRPEFDTTALAAQFPSVAFATGSLPQDWLGQIETVVLSPGIAKSEAWVLELMACGAQVIGDIELFARAVGKPVIAITGSNGKSTVTTLVAEVLEAAGYQVGVGGNIGEPALNLLHDDEEYDLFVLELSSFQLETTHSLQTVSATILNVSEDHMDRYEAIEDYLQAKMTILSDTDWTVLPTELQDLSLAHPNKVLRFGLTPPENACDYGLIEQDGVRYLGCGEVPLLAIADMAEQAPHYQLNALATMALCRPFTVLPEHFAKVFAQFTGLPHRTQLVLTEQGVDWINDSKGTNVGATVTALNSFASQAADQQGQVVLLAGGVGKDADFSELAERVAQLGAQVILFGRDAAVIGQSLQSDFQRVETLEQAILLAKEMTRPGDIVLFSPACASFDQFENYVHRGEQFEQWVKAWVSQKESA